jgi:hypothetical protein
MALTNYTDLQAAIATWLMGRTDLSVVIPDFITLFEATANRRLRVRQQETATAITPVSGVATLPTDYLAWKRLTWSGDVNRELEYVHPAYLKAVYPTAPAGLPSLFTIEGSSLLLRPVDDTAVNLLYWAKIPALSSGTNWLMTAHPDLYLFGSLVEANAFIVDPEKAALWKLRRDELFDELEKLDGKTRGPSAPRVMGVTP